MKPRSERRFEERALHTFWVARVNFHVAVAPLRVFHVRVYLGWTPQSIRCVAWIRAALILFAIIFPESDTGGVLLLILGVVVGIAFS